MDVAATLAIQQLIARYSDALWRLDADAFAVCWSTGGEWRMMGGVLVGHGAILEGWRASMASFARAWQTSHNIVIETAGETGSGRMFVEEWLTAADDGPAQYSRGIYHDDYVVEDGAWRFARRHYDLVYFGPPDFSGRLFGTAAYGAPPHDPDPARPATPSQAEFLGTPG